MSEISASKYTTMCGYRDAPHLDQAVLEELIESTPPHLRKARFEGIPSVSEGAIYPFEPEEISVDPFQIPEHWPRAYGMDVGWNWTAAVWGAIDRDTDTHYLYAAYKRGQAEPPIHAKAILARGAWVPGVIDPAANNRSQIDGQRLMALYRENGLDIEKAENSVEAGINTVWEMLSTGRLKVFSSLTPWFNEQRYYRRHVVKNDKLGTERVSILKTNDHLMDASRYLVMSGFKRAITRPVANHGRTAQLGDPVIGY